MPVNKNEIRKDVLAKAMQCKTADELMELAPKTKRKLILRNFPTLSLTPRR